MRIVIDMQGAQGESRHRGIGRYCLALALAIAKNRNGHDIIIALNGLFPDSIEPIRSAFEGLLPQENIRVWDAPSPLTPLDANNKWRRLVAEMMREAFLADLNPDFIHVMSPFEGFGDDAVFSIGKYAIKVPTAVTVHDFIPLLFEEIYLTPNPVYESFYRERMRNLRQADLFLAVSESTRRETIELLETSADVVVNTSEAATGNFKPANLSLADESEIRELFALKRPFLMYSSATDERKNHLGLIRAFSILPLNIRANYQLVFVGGLPDENLHKFKECARLYGLDQTDFVITGWVSDENMIKLYSLCELFVFPSLHEGFGLPVIEAMSCGAPVIGANTSSLPEVIGRADALFDPFDVNSISDKIFEVISNQAFRNQLIKHSLTHSKKFSWDGSAKRAIRAFEISHSKKELIVTNEIQPKPVYSPIPSLIESISLMQPLSVDDNSLPSIAKALARNHTYLPEKQLLIDISELITKDAKTGIQRVVRNVLSELLANPPKGFRVEPIYANTHEPGYRFARNYTCQLLNKPPDNLEDDWVEAFNGDYFVGLDLQKHVVLYQTPFYTYLRNIGAKVYFIVYDILPILLPVAFPNGAKILHEQWLTLIAEKSDGVMCISRAVADEVFEWLSVCNPKRLRSLKLGWFHLGADIEKSKHAKHSALINRNIPARMSARPIFLMVGTVEPRKGHALVVKAFEQLWDGGVDVNLVLVGKVGWEVETLVEKIRSHPQLDRRLFWLEGCSDEYLEKVYSASSCLIAASEGEGFGLPLVEAAQHRIPIIAREIPVFYEVAGKHAFYFQKKATSEELMQRIEDWLLLYKQDNHPKSENIPFITWKQCTNMFINITLKDKWYKSWNHNTNVTDKANTEKKKFKPHSWVDKVLMRHID